MAELTQAEVHEVEGIEEMYERLSFPTFIRHAFADWLAAHDASVVAAARADAEGRLGEVRRLADEWADEGVGLGASALLADVAADLRAALDAAGPREGEL